MRALLGILVASCFLAAQPPRAKVTTVARGSQADVIVAVESPRVGDMIDILTSNPDGRRVDIFLPDGHELADDSVEQNGISLQAVLPAELGELDPRIRNSLLIGAGYHLVLSFMDEPQGGKYRLRVDNRNATADVRVEAVFIRGADILMESLRHTPGIQIAGPVKVSPGSTGRKLTLQLLQSTEEALIDVACTEDQIAIQLRLPDGTVITQQNANANGLEWGQDRYPPDLGGDDFAAPFVAGMLEATSLPIDGKHYQIGLKAGVRQAGTYTVEIDGRQSHRLAEVSAMFVPVKSVLDRLYPTP